MKTDYLDLVQFHISPSRQTLEQNGALDALLELQAAGKVRFIGMSGTFPNLRDHIAMGVFDVFQIPYSAVEREHEDAISEAAEAGAGIVVRGGAAKGTVRRETGRTAVGPLAEGTARRPPRRHAPVAFVLRFTFSHPHAYDDRGDREPGAPRS
jgi:aryl-alcohol dehydrogenase-like predicted oxidoreductase